MTEGWFKTICALVGLVAGGIGIYKAIVKEPVDEKDAAPFIQALSATGETNSLSSYTPNRTTDIYAKFRNLGKRDAVEVKVNPRNTLVAVFDTEGIPVVWGPREEVTVHMHTIGSPIDVAMDNSRDCSGSMITNEDGYRQCGHYRYTGTVEWLDRASGKTGRSEWCFEGDFSGAAEPYTKEKPFSLEPCNLK